MSGSVSYAVSSTLTVRGDAQRVLAGVGRELAALDRRIKSAGRDITALVNSFQALARASQATGQATAGLRSLRAAAQGASAATRGATRAVSGQTAALNASATAAARAAQAATQAVSGQTAALNANATAAMRAAQAATQAATAMRGLGAVPPPQRMTVPPGGGGGAPRARESRFSRGINDPTPGQVYGVARGVAADFGAVMQAGGTEQQAMTMMRARGMSDAERDRVRQAAIQMTAEVRGTTVVEAIGAVMEARSAVGGEDIGQALALAPSLLRAARLSGTLSGRGTAEGMRPIARSLAIRGSFTDERGELNVEQGRREAQMLEDMLIAFSTSQGEGIAPRELENFFKQAGIAGRRMSIESVTGPMASLMQEVGGLRAGTMATAFYDQFISASGNNMPKNRLKMMGELGLMEGQTPAQRRETRAYETRTVERLVQEGRLSDAEAAAVRERQARLPAGDRNVIGRSLATVRPDLYIQEIFAERMRNQPGGATGGRRRFAAEIAASSGGAVSEDDLIDLFDKLGQRATGRRFGMSNLQEREVQADIANRERVTRMRASGTDPTGIVLNEGFANSFANVQSGFTNMLTALGNSPQVVTLLNETAQGLNQLAAAARDNPQFMERVVSELRRFLVDLRAFIGELAGVVSAVSGVVETVRGVSRAVNHAANEARSASMLNLNRSNLNPFAPERPRQPGEPTQMPEYDAMGNSTGRMVDTPPRGPAAGTPLDITPGAPIPPNPNRRSDLHFQNFDPGRPGGEPAAVQEAALYLDGQRVGRALLPHLGRAAGGASTGRGSFDTRRSLAPVDVAVA